MDLILKRTQIYQDGVFGTLSVRGTQKQIAVTLERYYKDLQGPKIPEGRYLCERGVHKLASSLNSFVTYEVKNVPERWGILFHMGNYPDESEGCILLGRSVYSGSSGPIMITDSKTSFDRFMQSQENSKTLFLTVRNQTT